jgi:hypothetical protein
MRLDYKGEEKLVTYFVKLSQQMDGAAKRNCGTTGRACSLVRIRTRYLPDTFVKRYSHTEFLCLRSADLKKRNKMTRTER